MPVQRAVHDAAKGHVHGIAIFPNFKKKYLDLKVLRFSVDYVLLSQIPSRTFN